MDKINELKEKLSNEFACTNGVHYGSGECDSRKRKFISGFDAAMGLQLPVKFLQFWWEGEWLKLDGLKDLDINNAKELFDYWIENIYQPKKL